MNSVYKEKALEQQLKWFEQKQTDGMPVLVAEKEKAVVGFGTFKEVGFKFDKWLDLRFL